MDSHAQNHCRLSDSSLGKGIPGSLVAGLWPRLRARGGDDCRAGDRAHGRGGSASGGAGAAVLGRRPQRRMPRGGAGLPGPFRGHWAFRGRGSLLLRESGELARDAGIFEQLPQVLDLARFPNIAVKASCMPSLVSEPYPYPTLQRAIQQVVEAFGPRRTFWGSDVSRLPCPYIENVRLFAEECAFLSDEDLDWIMGRAIAEWLEWK